ncbi:MAG TPA: helix-turn-helix domain-containing protein [Mycobacteriales bacterium]|jgi:sugar-specific transcriptional regulator TrmB/DNA-binding CsgD family transcriptional regulator
MEFLLHIAGIEPLEERLYRALLRTSPLSLPEIADTLGVPEGLLRGPVERLVAIGFVTTLTDEGDLYVPVPPDLALHLVVSREELKLQRRLEELSRLRGSAARLSRQLVGEAKESRIDVVHVVDGDPLVRRKMSDVALLARGEVRILEPMPLPEEDLETQPEVTRKVIYERAALDEPDVLDRVQRRQIVGDQVRLIPKPPARLVLADGDLAFVGLDPDPQGKARGALVHPSPLLATLSTVFDLLWDRAIPLDVGVRGGADTGWRISDEDAAMLRLLAAGLKDQAIARHLGIGLRTVVRRIGNLSRALDAETRFQAGLQAARRGLL